LFDVVSEYGDIVFGLQSGKQKFPGMWGLYSWGDLNIYLVLFRTSSENENQSRSTVWWWRWSVFQWQLINILQSWTIHT
jgi:hypothetical protein